MAKNAKIRHGIKQQHRFASNPEEKRFAQAWANRQRDDNTLAYLMGDGKNPSPLVSAHDHEVAATVIQWLGSEVGRFFLSEMGYVPTNKTLKYKRECVARLRHTLVERTKKCLTVAMGELVAMSEFDKIPIEDDP